INDRVTGVEAPGGQVQAGRLEGGQSISCGAVVEGPGPMAPPRAPLLGVGAPPFAQRPPKPGLPHPPGVGPRHAAGLSWADPQRLDWTDEERVVLAEDPATRPFVDEMPAGAHLRPEGVGGSDIVLMLWAFDAHPVPIVFPPEFDEMFPEVVLRGLCRIVPGLARYVGHAPRPSIDGGYYVKTRENRLLAGPLPVAGAFVIAGLSGYGLMAACAAADLLADHITGARLPPYAAAFSPERYNQPEYLKQLENWDDNGQL